MYSTCYDVCMRREGAVTDLEDEETISEGQPFNSDGSIATCDKIRVHC